MRQSPTNMKFIDLEDNKQCKTNKNWLIFFLLQWSGTKGPEYNEVS
jgi:hypothetical protein